MSEERIEQREAYSRRVVVYESERTAEQLERTAIARGHSLAAEVREAVRAHLRRLEERSVQGGTP